jgi:hypothetical protein
MKPVILLACFLPLGMIFIIMKLSVWLSAVNDENAYVREDAKRSHGPYTMEAYIDVDEKDDEWT